MDRRAYLQALDEALSGLVPGQERAEILRYYGEYFDEAGPEGEASVMERLGNPAELAKKLAAEAGYDAPAAEPVPPRKRRVWPWVVLGAVVALALLGGGLAARFSTGVDDPVQTVDPDISVPWGRAAASGEAFDKIEIEAPVANVTIQTGEDHSVELEWLDDGQYTLNYSLSRSVLRITGSPNGVGGHRDTRVLITVPEGASLDEIDIELGSGDVTVERVTVNEVSCWTGLGDITWNGPLARDGELTTGLGDIRITTGTMDGWECELNTGLGELVVDGTRYRSRYERNGSSGELEANTGTGDIALTTGRQ